MRAAVILALALAAWAGEPLRVVASVPELGAIARAIGGEDVAVTVLARPSDDPHRVELGIQQLDQRRVELGNPRQTERSGFVEGSAKAGDAIVVLGNRSLDPSEKRMKAVRITVAGKTYDIYPERIRAGG